MDLTFSNLKFSLGGMCPLSPPRIDVHNTRNGVIHWNIPDISLASHGRRHPPQQTPTHSIDYRGISNDMRKNTLWTERLFEEFPEFHWNLQINWEQTDADDFHPVRSVSNINIEHFQGRHNVVIIALTLPVRKEEKDIWIVYPNRHFEGTRDMSSGVWGIISSLTSTVDILSNWRIFLCFS